MLSFVVPVPPTVSGAVCSSWCHSVSEGERDRTTETSQGRGRRAGARANGRTATRPQRHPEPDRAADGPGNTGDAQAAPSLIEDVPAGTEVLGDTAYSAGEFRKHLEDNEMTAVIGPMPLRPAVEGGYTIEDFEIDRGANTVTCPNGVSVKINLNGRARFGNNCATCPFRRRCTKSKAGRTIVLNEHHDLLVAARHLAATVEFDETHRVTAP